MTCCLSLEGVRTSNLAEETFLKSAPSLSYLENVLEIVENSIKLLNFSFGYLSNSSVPSYLHRAHTILHYSCVVKSCILVKDIKIKNDLEEKKVEVFDQLSRVFLFTSYVISLFKNKKFVNPSVSVAFQLASRCCALKILKDNPNKHCHYKRDLIYHISGCAIDLIKICRLKKSHKIFKPLTCVIAIIHSASAITALHKGVIGRFVWIPNLRFFSY